MATPRTAPPAPADAAVDPWAVLLGELDWWIGEHGGAYVPQAATSRVIDGRPFPLGARLTQRRYDYRRGRLSAERVRDLEAREGWEWSGFAPRSAQVWDGYLEQVRSYVAAHGSLTGLETHLPLAARWLREQRVAELTTAQRRELRKIPGALQERKSRLEDFLVVARSWLGADPERDAGQIRWTTVHRVRRTDVPLGKRAAYWRSRYAEGRLAPEEIAEIEALPGWDWSAPRSRPPAEVGDDEASPAAVAG